MHNHKYMKNLLSNLLLIGIVLLVILSGIAYFSPFPRAPFGIHSWLPVPVACVSYSCVTYWDWSRSINNGSEAKKNYEALSNLINQRAFRLLAFQKKIIVTDDEVTQAQGAIKETLSAVPGGEQLLSELYNGDFEGKAGAGLKDFILIQKMRALGITTPLADGDFKVRVLNNYLKWNPEKSRVEGK